MGSSIRGPGVPGPLLRTYRRAARRLRRHDGGAVAVMFGLAILPLVLAAGVAIDYSRTLTARERLNAALDSAAMAVVAKAADKADLASGEAAARATFNELVGRSPGVSLTSFNVTTSASAVARFVTVDYSATMETSFTKVIGKRNIAFSGSASAETTLPAYIDFHLLLDNSPSMGLAASDGDIARMMQLTGCAFACHKHVFDSTGKIIGDEDGIKDKKTNPTGAKDAYHIARENGVKLRIDVMREATQKLVDTASATQTLPNQFRMSVAVFSEQYQQLAALSSNLPAVKTAAGGIDLAYSLYGEPDAQTSFDVALPAANLSMGNPGTGEAAAAPSKFLFLVTDGVQDETVANLVGAAFPSDGKPGGNVNGNRYISTLDQRGTNVPREPWQCKAIKDRGIKVAVLYTPYLPLPDNGFYNQWIAPISAEIPKRLKACASGGFYFEITATQGIDEAMQKMFQTALKSARLTR